MCNPCVNLYVPFLWLGRLTLSGKTSSISGLYLQLVDHYFRLLQLLKSISVPAFVCADGLPLGPQHFEVQLDELKVRRRRCVRFPAQLSLEPSPRVQPGLTHKNTGKIEAGLTLHWLEVPKSCGVIIFSFLIGPEITVRAGVSNILHGFQPIHECPTNTPSALFPQQTPNQFAGFGASYVGELFLSKPKLLNLGHQHDVTPRIARPNRGHSAKPMKASIQGTYRGNVRCSVEIPMRKVLQPDPVYRT